MWPRKQEWERLENRVLELENKVRNLPPEQSLSVPTGKKVFNGYWHEDEYKSVRLDDAVRMMMDALGLVLKHDAGTPPTERIEKKK